MAYYWVTEAQKYIQSLGFGSTRRPVNKESQDIRINQWGVDNSFSWDKKDLIKLRQGRRRRRRGRRGDPPRVRPRDPWTRSRIRSASAFGFEAGAIGEGFADYWAVTVSNVLAPTPDAPCVADWDSVSYTSTVPHCLRRTDLNLHYPEDVNAEQRARDGPDLVARALGHPSGTRPRRRGHDHPRRSVRDEGPDDGAARCEHGRQRSADLRRGHGEHRPRGFPGTRHPELTAQSRIRSLADPRHAPKAAAVAASPQRRLARARPTRARRTTSRGLRAARSRAARRPRCRPSARRAQPRRRRGSSGRRSASSPRRSPSPASPGHRT